MTLIKILIAIIIPLLVATDSYCGSRERIREEAFNNYRAGLYEKAHPLLLQLLEADSTADSYNDYLMLVDIYLRKGLKDSALYVVALGKERTENNPDPRVVKRNADIWQNVERQLLYYRERLDIPPFMPLADYEEKQPDTLTGDTLSVDSAQFAVLDTLESIPDTSGITPDSEVVEIIPPDSAKHSLPPQSPMMPGMSGPGVPSIVGGEETIKNYIREHALYPDSALKASIPQGAGVVDVTVDTSGNPIQFNIFREFPEGMGFGELALQVLQAMEYRPALIDSRKVKAVLRQPVMFRSPVIGGEGPQ